MRRQCSEQIAILTMCLLMSKLANPGSVEEPGYSFGVKLGEGIKLSLIGLT